MTAGRVASPGATAAGASQPTIVALQHDERGEGAASRRRAGHGAHRSVGHGRRPLLPAVRADSCPPCDAHRILVGDAATARSRRRTRASCARSRRACRTLRLLTDPADRESYRRDETAYLAAGLPLAVALPVETAEVVELVRLCGEHDVPIVPARRRARGCRAAAAGIEGALTIAFTRMDRILEIDRENLTVTTQPGIVNADLKAAVAAEGLFYAPDPASYEMCTIGGNLGTNAGGLCCVKYGVTRDAVLGLEVVMADGTLLRLGGKNVKDVAGYGLIPLLVGSQGTLGLMTEATLRLRPAPPPRVDAARVLPVARGRRARRWPGLTAAGPRAGDARAAWTGSRSGRSTTSTGWAWTATPPRCCSWSRTCPGGAAVGRDRRGGAGVRGRRARRSVVRAADPQEADWLRQGRRLAFRALEHLGRRADGGRRRPAQPRARDARGDRGDRRAAPDRRSGRSGTRATATCTRRSCWPATRTRRRPWRGSRRPATSCTRPRSRSAGR